MITITIGFSDSNFLVREIGLRRGVEERCLEMTSVAGRWEKVMETGIRLANILQKYREKSKKLMSLSWR